MQRCWQSLPLPNANIRYSTKYSSVLALSLVADAVSEEIGQNYTHYLNAQTIANNNAVIITNYLFNLL